MEYSPDAMVFIGLGNEQCGDDGAGIRFVEHLQLSGLFPGAKYIIGGTTPENHLGEIVREQPQAVIFVDAANWGAAAGALTWLTEDQIDTGRLSTHAFSLTLLARYLRRAVDIEVKYLVIQPERTDIGTSLSGSVERALAQMFA